MTAELKTLANESEHQSYLSFQLAEELFAIRVNKILEIIEVPRLTRLPNVLEYMKGVVNLRGKALPVADTRLKLGMPAAELSINSCIVVVSMEIAKQNVTIGLLVDTVLEVFELDSKHIQSAANIKHSFNQKAISGMVNHNDKFMMLLHVENLFGAMELNIGQTSVNNQENPDLVELI